MPSVMVPVSLLVLGCVWTLEALPVLPDPLYPTQENFNLGRFLGKWHDVAVATTCPYMQSHKGNSPVGTLDLAAGDSADKIVMKYTSLRHGACKEIDGDYELTTTPGRFFYTITKWNAVVDAYVVHTNYDEYAILIMSKQKASGKSISLKLYSRTMEVRGTVLEDFKTLVREQGMGEDTIIIKQNKGECVPGVEVVESPTPLVTELLLVQRARRSALLSDVEGSGDDTSMLIRGPDACKGVPDAGPCFGMLQKYFYNSSSMSCQVFTYGGCLGNQNSFDSERECLQHCRTEAVCRLPMAPYPCTGQPLIWAFDSVTGLCMSYKPGFCQGNGNKFYTKAECEEYCGVAKDE